MAKLLPKPIWRKEDIATEWVLITPQEQKPTAMTYPFLNTSEAYLQSNKDVAFIIMPFII